MDLKDYIKDNDKILSAMAQIYIALYIYDLKENKLEPIKTNEHIEKWASEVDGAQEKTNNVMSKITEEGFLDDILNFVDFSTLDERMKGKSSISQIFLGKINGWSRASFIAIDYDEDGKLCHAIYTVENIDEEKKKEDYLLYLAQTDFMTDISNRGYGERAIDAAIKNGKKGLFCLFDIDRFKGINDVYGHKIGDEVLIAVAACLKKVKRKNDIIMRLGGDEFAAYFMDIETRDDANVIIKELFDEIEKISVEPMTKKVCVSLGAAFCNSSETDFDELYKLSDKGVYVSKRDKGSTFIYM